MTAIAKPEPAGMPGESRSPLLLRIGFWICIVIAVAVVVIRLVALASPARNVPPEMAGLDHSFRSHETLTLAHIIPALLFALLTPFAVFKRFAANRFIDRLLFPLGLIIGLTAYAMSSYAVGGWIEISAVLFFNTLFLYALGRAWLYSRRPDQVLKRRWLLRSIAILLGIATTRPVMGVFFATSRATHLTPSQFFGIAFWIGFSISVLVFELWLRSVDRNARLDPILKSSAPASREETAPCPTPDSAASNYSSATQ